MIEPLILDLFMAGFVGFFVATMFWFTLEYAHGAKGIFYKIM